MSESNSNFKDRVIKASNEGGLQGGSEGGLQEKGIQEKPKKRIWKKHSKPPSVSSDESKKIEIPNYPNKRGKTPTVQASIIKNIEILYDMLKEDPRFEDFFNEEDHKKFSPKNLQELKLYVHNNINGNSQTIDKISRIRVNLNVSKEFNDEYDNRVNAFQDPIVQESPQGGLQGGSGEEGIQESPQEGFEESPEAPKQNMVVLYDDAQKALAKAGIETPLDNLLLPSDLKERFLANPDDSIDDVIREASKNYAINVYKQRYKDIEDSSFREFLRDAINEGLINPYKYYDKNREEHVMYLFGDKAMTEPELREEFNKYRFKNLVKGSKNKLHEFAERAIMKKREKQLEAYKEMKQTTHDAIRPKMVLNPMLFNHN